jgi:hypothetical protein
MGKVGKQGNPLFWPEPEDFYLLAGQQLKARQYFSLWKELIFPASQLNLCIVAKGDRFCQNSPYGDEITQFLNFKGKMTARKMIWHKTKPNIIVARAQHFNCTFWAIQLSRKWLLLSSSSELTAKKLILKYSSILFWDKRKHVFKCYWQCINW